MAGNKNSGRRNQKVLPADAAEQVEKLAPYLSKEMIADYLGVSRVTLAAKMDADPALEAAYMRGKAKAIAVVSGGLLAKAREGDTASAIFYLKTQAGWRETNRTEVTGANGGPIQTEDVTRDAEQFARRIASLTAGPDEGSSGPSA